MNCCLYQVLLLAGLSLTCVLHFMHNMIVTGGVLIRQTTRNGVNTDNVYLCTLKFLLKTIVKLHENDGVAANRSTAAFGVWVNTLSYCPFRCS